MPKVFLANARIISRLRATENQLGTVTEVIDDGRAAKRYRVSFDNGRVEVVTNRGIDPAPAQPANVGPNANIQPPPGIDDDEPPDSDNSSPASSDPEESPSSVNLLFHTSKHDVPLF